MKYNFSRNGKDFLGYLPVEISLQILNLLNAEDLHTCSQVSRVWNELSNDQLLWLNKCTELQVPKESMAIDGESLKHKYYSYYTLLSNWKTEDQIKPSVAILSHGLIITGLMLLDNWLVSGSDDGTVAVMDMSLGEIVNTFRAHMNGVWAMEIFRIDGQIMLATSSTDCTVCVWQLLTSKSVFVFNGHERIIRCLTAFTVQEDNNQKVRLISGSRDSTIRVWDLKTGQCVYVLNGHIGAIRCVKVDSYCAVSGSYDHSVRVWNLETGACRHVLIGHTNRIYALYLGKQVILSSSLDTTIRVWHRVKGICTQILSGHRSLTCEIVMNTEESLAISGNADKSVRVWNISTGECLFNLGTGDINMPAVTGVQVVLDKFIVSSGADGTVKLWSLNDGSFIREIVRVNDSDVIFQDAIVWRSVSDGKYFACGIGSRSRLEMNKIFLFDFSVKKKNGPCNL